MSRDITITASLHPEIARQLAQFCKRSTFEQFYQLTEAHLSHDERKDRAYQMIAGVDAVARALADVGFSPR